MKLADLTWPQVDALDRGIVVLIPTGSLEQHGEHLPLLTDSILVTAVAEAVEATLPEDVLLLPTTWLGASQHHLPFAGSLSASFESYHQSLLAVVRSLVPHRFRTFFVMNGHGGNTELNGVAIRALKQEFPNSIFCHTGYWESSSEAIASVMEGPSKQIQHACEGETSLMMYVRPDLVRLDKRRKDGLKTEPSIPGVVWQFDEMTEMGSFGDSTLATAEKGKVIFDAAVSSMCDQVKALRSGVKLVG